VKTSTAPRTQLVVVALGERVALVGPDGATAVLPADAVGALGDSLHDTLVAKVHGGDVRTGEVKVAANHEVFLTEKAAVSVTARPHTETVELNFEFISARLTCWPTLDEIRALKQMLADAETTMLRPGSRQHRRHCYRSQGASAPAAGAVGPHPPRHHPLMSRVPLHRHLSQPWHHATCRRSRWTHPRPCTLTVLTPPDSR
jgi:hypothetical protein